MKNVYQKPEMLIVNLDSVDMIATSENFAIQEQTEKSSIAGAEERKDRIWD